MNYLTPVNAVRYHQEDQEHQAEDDENLVCFTSLER